MRRIAKAGRSPYEHRPLRRKCRVTKLLVSILSTLALLSAVPTAMAQDAYPTKPIRLVVPFAAAGPTDIIARLVAQKMTESLGQQIVIDNRGGAGGNLGSDIVAKAPGDGYTLL